MNTSPTQTNKSDYLLLFRGPEWYNDVSPEELQVIMGKFQAWFDDVSQKGIVKAAAPLKREGKVISGKSGRHTADGPFAESKETIGGYLLISVGSFEEALALAKTSPALEHETVIELRPVAETCPVMDRLNQVTAKGELAAV